MVSASSGERMPSHMSFKIRTGFLLLLLLGTISQGQNRGIFEGLGVQQILTFFSMASLALLVAAWKAAGTDCLDVEPIYRTKSGVVLCILEVVSYISTALFIGIVSV